MILKMQATNVLQRTIEAAVKYKIILHEGGSRSSKTFSIFQFFLLKSISGEKFELTVVRNSLSWVKETLLKDFEEITGMYKIPVTPAINRNRPEQIYQIFNSTWTF